MSGKLVISLDFEKYWGMRDHQSIDDYRENLDNVDEVVVRLLEFFKNTKFMQRGQLLDSFFIAAKMSYKNTYRRMLTFIQTHLLILIHISIRRSLTHNTTLLMNLLKRLPVYLIKKLPPTLILTIIV